MAEPLNWCLQGVGPNLSGMFLGFGVVPKDDGYLLERLSENCYSGLAGNRVMVVVENDIEAVA